MILPKVYGEDRDEDETTESRGCRGHTPTISTGCIRRHLHRKEGEEEALVVEDAAAEAEGRRPRRRRRSGQCSHQHQHRRPFEIDLQTLGFGGK